MCAYGQEYSIDYEQYQGKHHITDEEDCIERIAHKVFYDFQINAFLFCKDIAKYSTICSMPEFIYTVSNLSKDAEKMRSLWKRERKAYVIKYKSYIKNFACFTFYESESDYEEDVLHGFIKLKKKLISLAIIGMHGELRGDVFVYMEPLKSVLPENILEIVSAEEWRKNVLKYFGETGNL